MKIFKDFIKDLIYTMFPNVLDGNFYLNILVLIYFYYDSIIFYLP